MNRPRTELQNFLSDMGAIAAGYSIAGFCFCFGGFLFFAGLHLVGGLL